MVYITIRYGLDTPTQWLAMPGYYEVCLILPSINTLYKNITICLYFSPNVDIIVYLFNVLLHFYGVFGGIKCPWYMHIWGLGATRYSGLGLRCYYIWAQLSIIKSPYPLPNHYLNNQ
jgi:hypothetical protein